MNRRSWPRHWRRSRRRWRWQGCDVTGRCWARCWCRANPWCGTCLCAISPAGVQGAQVITAAPNDHLTARPYCRVRCPGFRRVDGAGERPTIDTRVVSPAGGQTPLVKILSTPDNHFSIAPHRCVPGSPGWPDAGGCPTIFVVGLYLPPVSIKEG